MVQHHLETFLAQATRSDPRGYGIRSGVEKDLRAYLRCGILAHGFARLRCSGCGHERLLAFSCKSRGVCLSCNTRRMAEVAAHITDHVLPQLPVRQWVLSLPKRLRPFLETNPDIAGAVLRIFVRAVRIRYIQLLEDELRRFKELVEQLGLPAVVLPRRGRLVN